MFHIFQIGWLDVSHGTQSIGMTDLRFKITLSTCGNMVNREPVG